MKTLYSTLYVGRERRGLLPAQSVEEISIFIDGYAAGNARSKTQIKDAELEHFYGFQKWMEVRTGLGHRPWSILIRFYCLRNDESLDKFFEFLDEYREKVPLE